jgi:hypothetical protein
MSRSISARFTTLCGARQYMTIASPPPPEYSFPIKTRDGSQFDSPITYRVFKLVSVRPVDESVDADYVEVYQ